MPAERLPSTTGVVVCDERGLPIWIGHPDKTDSPHMTIYDDYAKARRALTRIWKATRYHTGDTTPYRLAQVTVQVEKLGEPITPKLRGNDDA